MNDYISAGELSEYSLVLLEALNVNAVLKETVSDLFRVAENKIGLEILCDGLYEDKTAIQQLHYIQLVTLCCYFNIEAIYFQGLAENVSATVVGV